MALVRDFHLYQRILVAVFPHNRLPGVRSAAGEECVIIGRVLKYDGPVVFRMDVFFHLSLFYGMILTMRSFEVGKGRKDLRFLICDLRLVA